MKKKKLNLVQRIIGICREWIRILKMTLVAKKHFSRPQIALLPWRVAK